MSLVSTDKNSLDRSAPSPNTHDRLSDRAGITGRGTTSLHNQSPGIPVTSFIQTKDKRVLAYDGSNNRALVGFNSNTGTWGVFTTPPGTDVLQVSNPKQYSTSSDYQSMVVLKTGIITIPSPGAQVAYASGTTGAPPFAHGLGFIPSFSIFSLAPVAYFNNLFIGNNVWIATGNGWADGNSTGVNVFYNIGAATDATNLYVFNTWGLGASNFTPLAVKVTYILYALSATAT